MYQRTATGAVLSYQREIPRSDDDGLQKLCYYESVQGQPRQTLDGVMMVEPIRVLIVDDQPRARKSLQALLSTWPRIGEMHEAGNGREARQLVGELQPDVVLMDARMPELDGLKATLQIKALWPQVKVIILSMYLEYRDEALAAGADAFVGKAEAPDKLLDLLSVIMHPGI
jgi:DNA-binding NarL/FixJ family response regulator